MWLAFNSVVPFCAVWTSYLFWLVEKEGGPIVRGVWMAGHSYVHVAATHAANSFDSSWPARRWHDASRPHDARHDNEIVVCTFVSDARATR